MPEFLNLNVLTIVLGLVILFNLGLLVWLTRLSQHYNSFTKGVDKKSLMAVLEGIQKTLANHERSLMVEKKETVALKQESLNFLQHLQLKRFNPFSDTGGDQSFMLALLDGNRDGVVITSLHSRENTRFYVKSVKGGEGLEHPLSKEEQKIVKL